MLHRPKQIPTSNKAIKTYFIGSLSILLPLLSVNTLATEETDITHFSLEELMNMEVSSVAKKNQPMSDAAAAIYVITSEDIRRSGLASIPELLRLVPGMQVAHIDGNKWAISSRGFNSRWASKLLVLMDGRTLYNPMFSGVYWDVQGTVINDIERIEVIRGSGGAVWGANAMNGVINIITRHSRDTQNGLITASVGDLNNNIDVRFGGQISDNAWFKVYAQSEDKDDFNPPDDNNAHDAQDMKRLGFKTDWSFNSGSELSIHGDTYRGDVKSTRGDLENVYSSAQFIPVEIEVTGSNLVARYSKKLSENSSWTIQGYIDKAKRLDSSTKESVDTYDLEFQHNFSISDSQVFNWGLSYRSIDDSITGDFTVIFDPISSKQELYGAFFQDEIKFSENATLTFGSKFEHNYITGIEAQPSIRMLWGLAENQRLWASWGKSVATPARVFSDIRINAAAFSSPYVDPDGPGPLPAGAPILVSIVGNKNIKSEYMESLELGYRNQLDDKISIDATVFHNHYSQLHSSERSFAIEGTPFPTHAVIFSTFDNLMEGESYGIELSTKFQIQPDWRIDGSFNWIYMDFNLLEVSTDETRIADTEDVVPKKQLQLHSYWDINDDISFNLSLYYVDKINVRNAVERADISAYTRLDLALSWQITDTLDMSIVGQNLLDDGHIEFYATDVLSTEVPRSFYLRINKQF